MEQISNYIKRNWIVLSVGFFFVGWFTYLTYTGNKFCDCTKSEKYQDGSSSSTRRSGASYYRYYHK